MTRGDSAGPGQLAPRRGFGCVQGRLEGSPLVDEGVEAAEVSGDKCHLSVAVPLVAHVPADLQRVIMHKAATAAAARPPAATCNTNMSPLMTTLKVQAQPKENSLCFSVVTSSISAQVLPHTATEAIGSQRCAGCAHYMSAAV